MKKYLSGVIAVLFAVSLTAFTRVKANNTTKLDNPSWELNSPNDNPSIASNYTQFTPGSGPSCSGSTTICTIVDKANSMSPTEPALEFGNPLNDPADYSAVLQSKP